MLKKRLKDMSKRSERHEGIEVIKDSSLSSIKGGTGINTDTSLTTCTKLVDCGWNSEACPNLRTCSWNG